MQNKYQERKKAEEEEEENQRTIGDWAIWQSDNANIYLCIFYIHFACMHVYACIECHKFAGELVMVRDKFAFYLSFV